jgi:hypothetical protein
MPRIKSLSVIRAQIRALEKRAMTIEAKADKKITQLVALIQHHGLSLSDWSARCHSARPASAAAHARASPCQ